MNSKSISVEKGYLWTGRRSIYGTRCVAIFDLGAVNGFMRKVGVVGVDAKAFLQGLKEDTVDKLLSEGVQVWLATVGPGDFLMVPSHVMIMEMCLARAATVCVWLRWCLVILRAASSSMPLQPIQQRHRPTWPSPLQRQLPLPRRLLGTASLQHQQRRR